MTRATSRAADSATPTEDVAEAETRPGFVTAVLTYVRTPGGVVQVEAGEPVPAEADAEHLEALVGAGVAVDPAAASSGNDED